MHEGMNERTQVGVIGELGLLGGPGAAAAAGKGALAGGGKTSLRGLSTVCSAAPLSWLLCPLRLPSLATLRESPGPHLGFSWLDPPWKLFLLDGAFPDPSSPPQVPIKCSKYFLLLNKANKGKGSLEAEFASPWLCSA